MLQVLLNPLGAGYLEIIVASSSSRLICGGSSFTLSQDSCSTVQLLSLCYYLKLQLTVIWTIKSLGILRNHQQLRGLPWKDNSLAVAIPVSTSNPSDWRTVKCIILHKTCVALGCAVDEIPHTTMIVLIVKIIYASYRLARSNAAFESLRLTLACDRLCVLPVTGSAAGVRSLEGLFSHSIRNQPPAILSPS